MPGLASEKKGDVCFSQVKFYGKSRHFVYVRALIMRKILRSTGCAMQYKGITLREEKLEKSRLAFAALYLVYDFSILPPNENNSEN